MQALNKLNAVSISFRQSRELTFTHYPVKRPALRKLECNEEKSPEQSVMLQVYNISTGEEKLNNTQSSSPNESVILINPINAGISELHTREYNTEFIDNYIMTRSYKLMQIVHKVGKLIDITV